MQTGIPSIEEWRRLYEAAMRVKEIGPWAWMEESDIFGVYDPETGELGFVSVMGQLGEHLSVAVYRGAEALYELWGFIEAAETGTVDPTRLFEIAQLQVSFEDREMIEKEDRQIMKELGLKFRGRQAWPQFRSYRPGFVPWFLETEEVRLLTLALEQLLDVAPRFEEDEDLLYPEGEDTFLTRVHRTANGSTIWEDEIRIVPPPEPQPIEIFIPGQIMEAVRSLPKRNRKLEVDFFMIPQGIREKKERPRYAYNLLVVDAQSGMVLGTDIVAVETTFDEMLASLPARLLQVFGQIGWLPREVRVASDRLLGMLPHVLAEGVGVKVRQVQRLPMLEEAKDAMFQFLNY